MGLQGTLHTLGQHHGGKRHAYPGEVDTAPEVSGIYVIFDKNDRCIYVGMSDSETTTIRSRLLDHVRGDEQGRCINEHLPSSFFVQTEDEIPRGRIDEWETKYITDYRKSGQAMCNKRS